MIFRLYKNKSDNRVLEKNLDLLKEIDGQLKDISSLEMPSIIITNSDDAISCNYVYIGTFKRYYYVTDKTALNSHLIELKLKVDVLKTFSKEIKNCKAFILRQENEFNVNFNDALLPIRSDINYRVYNFGSVPSNYKFYLTSNGGLF